MTVPQARRDADIVEVRGIVSPALPVSPFVETSRKVKPCPKPSKKPKARKYNGIKTTPADFWFSRCVRERNDWICEGCGKKYPEFAQGIHCSHYFSRGNWSVRLEPLNAFAHCFYCHQKLGSNPHLFVEWTKAVLGDRYAVLVELSQNITRAKESRQTKGKGEIARHYQNEYLRMVSMRARGVTGRIEFTGYF